MSPPASLPGGRPLCGRLPGQTPVPPHLSSPSPVFFLPPLPTSAGPVCPLLPVPPVLGCVSPLWDPAGPIPASGRSHSHPPTLAQPCRGGWGGGGLGRSRSKESTSAASAASSSASSCPQDLPGTGCQHCPGAPRPCFATVWCPPAAGPSRQPQERNVSLARVGKGQHGQRGCLLLPPHQHSARHVWRGGNEQAKR